jgi:hypothetical protein
VLALKTARTNSSIISLPLVEDFRTIDYFISLVLHPIRH